jgi:hypothetical protein
MKFIFFGLFFGVLSALYASYLVCSAVFTIIKKIFYLLFSIRCIFYFFIKRKNDKIAKVGDRIRWTMHNNCGILSGKVYESDVVMVDLEEKHYGVYAEYGQDLIPFESAVIIKVNHRITCGEKSEDGFHETYIGDVKTNTKILIFDKKKLIDAYKILKNEKKDI